MAIKIDTTVGQAAAELERSGVSVDLHVTMLVLEPEDEAKLADLRAAIAEGDASGKSLDSEEVFAGIKAELKRKFSQNYPS